MCSSDLIVPLLVTTPGLMVALLSPLAGLIADRHGRRVPILLATFFYAFAGAAPVVFGDLWAVLLSRVLVGISETFVLVIVNALFADYYDDAARRTWITVQGILGPFLGAASIAGAGALAGVNWSYVFLIYLLAFPIFLAMLVFFFEPERVDHHTAVAVEPNAAVRGRAFSWGTAAAYCSVTIFSSIIYYVFTVNGGLAFQAIGVDSPGRIGAIMGMAGLAVLPGALVFNLLSRRWSGERVIATFLLFLGLGTGGGHGGVPQRGNDDGIRLHSAVRGGDDRGRANLLGVAPVATPASWPGLWPVDLRLLRRTIHQPGDRRHYRRGWGRRAGRLHGNGRAQHRYVGCHPDPSSPPAEAAGRAGRRRLIVHGRRAE